MYPLPGSVNSTPTILPIFRTSPTASSVSTLSIIFPSSAFPAPPIPSPPKKLTVGRPHLVTFPKLQGSNDDDSPSGDPKIFHLPYALSKSFAKLAAPCDIAVPLRTVFHILS